MNIILTNFQKQYKSSSLSRRITIGENLMRDCVFVILAVLGNKNGNIPNREVKAHELDDTCCFGGWESRVRRHIKALFYFVSETSNLLYNKKQRNESNH